MTRTLETRLFATTIELRRGGDGRTVTGIAVPFGEVIQIPEGREVFRPGAFKRTIAERGPSRIKLLQQHDQSQWPVGVATVLREDPAGLYAEFKMATTLRGDEALTLVKDGVLDAFSIGFNPLPGGTQFVDGVAVRTEVRLDHVGLVSVPAYNSARVTGVRSVGQPALMPSVALARLRLASITS